MKKPQTFQIKEKDPDPNFTLKNRLDDPWFTKGNFEKVNSLSIPIILLEDGKPFKEAMITLLEGRGYWISEEESISYYQANTILEDKRISSIVCHHSRETEEDGYFVTLLEF